MSWLDNNPDILSWASEELIVPYISPVDQKKHRYFPDFVVRKRETDGKIKTVMVEIKPASQSKPPKHPGKVTKRYINEVYTWGVNEAKWKAAKEYCADRKWSFHVFTEKELGIKW